MILLEWLICFIATVAFGVIFNIPLRLLWWGGGAGVAAWIVYSTLPELGMSPVFAAAAAAFLPLLSPIGLLYGKKCRLPCLPYRGLFHWFPEAELTLLCLLLWKKII
nr:threonine/serine exporter family protein [Sinobaca sp. H24]